MADANGARRVSPRIPRDEATPCRPQPRGHACGDRDYWTLETCRVSLTLHAVQSVDAWVDDAGQVYVEDGGEYKPLASTWDLVDEADVQIEDVLQTDTDPVGGERVRLANDGKKFDEATWRRGEIARKLRREPVWDSVAVGLRQQA